ncbi:MAG: C40 family peptidase [Treponema sp.]|jgi:murein DD-endopeptidase|nr:C40 family peptidase [Treponema sp.]
MAIKWDRVIENEKRQFESMGEADRFAFFLMLQTGSPYGWGKESPESSDCSGAVCMALYAATGLLIRTTADDLYRRVFTKPNPRPSDIRAVFYITKKDKRHGDRAVVPGTAVHVAGILEDGIILNSQEPYAKLRRIAEVSDSFTRTSHEVVVRGLDRGALAKLAAEGKTRHGLDREFSTYFDTGE